MKEGALFPIFMILFWIIGIVMWGTNIIQFISLDFEEPYKAEILKGIGIPFAPMGIVLSIVDIDDTPKPK